MSKDTTELIRGLKLEYYELLHKHGFADFKLDVQKEPEGYAEDEVWLEEAYGTAFEQLISNREKLAREDELENLQGADMKLYTNKVITDRLATLRKELDREEPTNE